MCKELYNKFTVIKNKDLEKLNGDDSNTFHFIVEEMAGADLEKEYLVINRDEPYAKLVEKLILGEITEREIIETISRNCVAWDTSKDKSQGLLPEVAIFSNPNLYEKLLGNKYNFSEVCRKYNIDN